MQIVKTIVMYKGIEFKCETTPKWENDKQYIRVYDVKGVGNLYIWNKQYDMPRPYFTNTSKGICKNVVLMAFDALYNIVNNPILKAVAMTVLPEETIASPVIVEQVKTRTRQSSASSNRFGN